MLVEDVMVDGKDGSGAERVVAGLPSRYYDLP